MNGMSSTPFKAPFALNGHDHSAYNSSISHPPMQASMSVSSTAPRSSPDRVPTLIRALSRHILSHNGTVTVEADVLNDAIALSLAVLTSNMRSSHITHVADIAERIKLYAARHGDRSEPNKCDALLRHITAKTNITDKSAVLNLLYALRQSGNDQSFSIQYYNPINTTPKQTVQDDAPLQRDKLISTLQSTHLNHNHAMITTAPSNTTSATTNNNTAPQRHPSLSIISSADLIRDCLYCLQGVNGQYIQWQSDIHNPSKLSQFLPLKHLHLATNEYFILIKICELGSFYKQICAYINDVMDHSGTQAVSVHQKRRIMMDGASMTSTGTTASTSNTNTINADAIGLSEQSYVGAIRHQMNEYIRLIAACESNIKQSSANTFTLHRLYTWSVMPLTRLRHIHHMLTLTRGTHGGALINALTSFLPHANPTLSSITTTLLAESCRPLFTIILRWICSGELNDPYREFFVSDDNTVPMERLWTDKFTIKSSHTIPSFITQAMAERILSAGKSVYFIRVACHESKFMSTCLVDENNISKLFKNEQNQNSSLVQVQAAIDQALHQCALQTNQKLMNAFCAKYAVSAHALTFKKYILLSQGDWVTHLLDVIYEPLNGSARDITQRSLIALFEQSMRTQQRTADSTTLATTQHTSTATSSSSSVADASTASRTTTSDATSSDLLNRVTVKLLNRTSDNDVGWDVFSLDYMIDSPLNVLFTPTALSYYLRISHFLLRLKRAEYELSFTWMNQMSQYHPLATLITQSNILNILLRRTHLLRYEMSHIISNFISYIMYTVIETAWETWAQQLAQMTDMNALIAAHHTYLNTIMEKALLSGRTAACSTVLLRVFDSVSMFVRIARRIDESCQIESQRLETLKRAAAADKAADIAANGRSYQRNRVETIDLSQSPLVTAVPAFQDEIDRIANAFRLNLSSFIRALRHVNDGTNTSAPTAFAHEQASSHHGSIIANTDKTSARLVDLDDLRSQLDFNHFYASIDASLSSNANSTTTSGGNTPRPSLITSNQQYASVNRHNLTNNNNINNNNQNSIINNKTSSNFAALPPRSVALNKRV